MTSSFSCMNAEKEQACEESGNFELHNRVITKFESNSRGEIECTLGDQGEILRQSNRRTLW